MYALGSRLSDACFYWLRSLRRPVEKTGALPLRTSPVASLFEVKVSALRGGLVLIPCPLMVLINERFVY